MDPAHANPEVATTVTRDEDMWILRVESNGKVQEYRCNSEIQARALAILLLPASEQQPPTDLPPTVS